MPLLKTPRVPGIVIHSRGNSPQRALLWVGLVVCICLAGCESAAFYWQAGSGHLKLMQQRESIDALLADGELDPQQRARLEQAVAIRDYAEQSLGLPVEGSYHHLVELEDRYVTWNVHAAQPLAMEAVQWCFPVAGCVTYRGYFKPDAAEAFAERQRAEGLDVHLGGATAYSTLGWFNDPLLSSFLRYDDARLAALLFHELAHQVVYVKDDTAFNESFASAVEELGLRQWLADEGRQEELAAWVRHDAWVETFTGWLVEHREALQAIYASDADEAEKLARKEAYFAAMKADYPAFRDSNQGNGGFDAWMDRPLNNASLLSIGSYNDWVGAFKQLFEECGGNWQAFYQAAEALGEQAPELRTASLEALQQQEQVATCHGPGGQVVHES